MRVAMGEEAVGAPVEAGGSGFKGAPCGPTPSVPRHKI